MQSSTQQAEKRSAPGTARDGQKETQRAWRVGIGSKSGQYLVYAKSGDKMEFANVRFGKREDAKAFADAANEMMRCK